MTTPAAESSPSLLSSVEPRCLIKAPLRCDGIGRFDCAQDPVTGARMAVRWLPLDANGEAAVKACARLPKHPWLPALRQTGVSGGMAFMALDFPEGALLSTMIGDVVNQRVVLRMAAQLSDALAALHTHGVVHGEVSTDSVLVAGDATYLYDVPLVVANRLTDRRGENRLMHNLVRTAPFLAPERARGAGPSRESDVYALAAVLCVASGTPLPRTSSTLSTVYAVAQGHWAPRVPDALPLAVRELLEQMLSSEPSVRPTARYVAGVLAQPVEDESGEHQVSASAETDVRVPEITTSTEAAMGLDELTLADVPEVASGEVMQLPLVDLPAVLTVESTPLPRLPSAPSMSIALTDSIAVSPELVHAGAHRVIDDVVLPPPLPRPSRRRNELFAVGAVVLATLLAVAAVAVVLSRSRAVSAPAAATPAVVVPSSGTAAVGTAAPGTPAASLQPVVQPSPVEAAKKPSRVVTAGNVRLQRVE